MPPLCRNVTFFTFMFVSLLANPSYAAQNKILNVEGIEILYLSGPDSIKHQIVDQALRLSGTPYKYGGDSPSTGFDCSGLVHYVYKQVSNTHLPRTAHAMSGVGKAVPKENLQAGDLVFFNTQGRRYSHVGIYIGNDQFIHAPRSGRNVSIDKMHNRYWTKKYTGARRINP